MQILGLLGMYFDAVVVEVKTFLLLFRLALCYETSNFDNQSLIHSDLNYTNLHPPLVDVVFK